MAAYYVNTNAQSNGDHEVHRDWCYWLSLIKNPMYLGYFDSCYPAVQAAKQTYSSANGCAHCSGACHTG